MSGRSDRTPQTGGKMKIRGHKCHGEILTFSILRRDHLPLKLDPEIRHVASRDAETVQLWGVDT